MKSPLLSTALACCLGAAAFAAEPDHDAPETERQSFQLAPGFEAHLFASEADGVVKPIQIRWDTRGRLWVINSRTYPQIKPGEQPNDKVLILEDPGHTGHVTKVTTFADGLMIPTGLEVDGDGDGCWVGEGTRMLHLRDPGHTGHATSREVVLRGFGTGDAHQCINSFLWSPGGDLLFCQGLHSFSRVETPHGIVVLDEAGFWRFRPATMQLDRFYGGKSDPQNPWGWAFTNWGQPFLVAGNNGGIFYPRPEMVRGHDELRVGNIWLGARSRKTSGPDIVGTAHLPEAWQGTFLTGGYINNSVWAMKIDDDGSGYRLTDLPPLITSSHGSFRAVDVKIGPDGAIYLCDWYNPIIGHYQASFRHPDRDKVHGRIWRITATGRPLVQQPPIADAGIPQLLENLRSPERWTRYQSKRALTARPASEVIAALDKWTTALDPKDPQLDHLLYESIGVYESLDHPAPDLLYRLTRATSPEARAYAGEVVEHWADQLSDPLSLLGPLAEDENPRVRLGAVVAAGNIPRPQSLYVALAATKHPLDRFLETALHQAVLALKPSWLPQLQTGTLNLSDQEWENLARADATPDSAGILRKLLAAPALPRARRASLLQTLADVGTAEDLALLLKPEAYPGEGGLDTALEAQTLPALSRAFRNRHLKPAGDLAKSLPLAPGTLEAIRAEALRLAGLYKLGALFPQLKEATAAREPAAIRTGAIEGLAALGSPDAVALLRTLATSADPLEIRVHAISGLSQVDLPGAAERAAALLATESGTPLTTAILPPFLQRKGGADALAEAFTKQPPLKAAADAALQHLRTVGRSDEKLLAALTRPNASPSKLKATPEFVAALAAEVRASGNAAHGSELFHSSTMVCTACHSVGGQGGNIGPSLDAIGSAQPLDFIIGAVIDPQREVKEGFEAVEITTKDGQVLQGYRVREGGDELVLREVTGGKEMTFRRSQIAARREIGSLMPYGLLDNLKREDMRDLFRYLSELGKPK